MSNLNRDILYLIFEELQNDKKTFFSCIFVNKTWCETAIPILWRNPWKFLENKMSLFNVLISHFSDETRKKLSEYELLKEIPYQKLSFYYINFCRHLNLIEIQRIINNINTYKSRILLIQTEILKLFLNENVRITHLYISRTFYYKLHLLPESWFSGIKFLSCNTSTNDNIVRSIKLEDEIIRLIEAKNGLFNINLTCPSYCGLSFLQNSLIKYTNTIRPNTKLLSSFANLKELELNNEFCYSWNGLKDLSFSSLQYLKANKLPADVLTILIKNTNGSLIELEIDHLYDSASNDEIIQAISEACPNIKYLKLSIRDANILGFKNLLKNCQCLSELFIIIIDLLNKFHWKKLSEVLAKSSPASLFKFTFHSFKAPKLKLFFDNWENKHPPIILKIISNRNINVYLIEDYKLKGIVKNYKYDGKYLGSTFKI